MKWILLTIALCLSVVIIDGIYLFAVEDKPAEIHYGHYREIYSEVLQEDRRILVYLPQDYNIDEKSYPVLYKLDGTKEVFYQTSMAVWYLANMADRIPDHIVIAIENTDRVRDMNVDRGADQFLKFMKTELIPFVDGNYRTNGSRLLSGQSSSSMFACYAFLAHPDMFEAYVFNSFGFSDKGLELHINELLPKVSFENLPKRYVFITNAEKDPYDPNGKRTANGVKFLKALNEIGSNNIIVKYKTYNDEGHVPYPGLYDGLKWIYDNKK